MLPTLWSMLVALFAQDLERLRNEQPDVRCGAYCTYTALTSLNLAPPTFHAFEGQLGQPELIGYSLQQLCEGARMAGAVAVTVQLDLHDLESIDSPYACVALLKTGHFVLIADIGEDEISLVDPPESYNMRRGLFEDLWTGNALIISRQELDLNRTAAGGLPRMLGGALIAGAAVSCIWLLVKRRGAKPALVRHP